MGEPLQVPPPGFDDLTVEEQLDFVQELWSRISRRPEQVPVTEWQKRIIDERLEAMERDGDLGRTPEEVRAEVHARLNALKK